MPKRIQLKRSRGWRMPANTVKVDRSTKWGNPFIVGQDAIHPLTGKPVHVTAKTAAIALFAAYLQSTGAQKADEALRELKGKNLACWCKEGDGCHADILLMVANAAHTARRAA